MLFQTHKSCIHLQNTNEDIFNEITSWSQMESAINGGTRSSQISSKRSSFVFGRWTKVLQVWNNTRVS